MEGEIQLQVSQLRDSWPMFHFWMPWLPSMLYVTLHMKWVYCYGNAKNKQKKVELPLSPLH